MFGFRVFAMFVVLIGASQSIDVVWNLADVLMGVMAILNLPVIVLLSRPALAAMNDYWSQRKSGKKPVFKASNIGLKEKTDYWR